MNVSGILVVTSPEHTRNVIEQLQSLTGIITQEAESIDAEVDGLKRIRALPHIVLAEMSCHYFEEDQELVDAIPPELDDEKLASGSVPACLNE